ncbi:hypothetical protein C2E23DRAFT_808171, partial [Lenzites betulinus]
MDCREVRASKTIHSPLHQVRTRVPLTFLTIHAPLPLGPTHAATRVTMPTGPGNESSWSS